MSKKEKKYKLYNTTSSTDSEEVVKLLKIVGSVIGILLVFYLVFAIYNGEITFTKKEKEKKEVEIQNTEILAGSTFERQENEYYVLYYDFDGDNSIKCNSLYTLYSQNSSKSKMYLVNLASSFNEKYVTKNIDEVNAKSISSLKVVDATLVKITNKKAEVIAKGIEELNNYQSELLK